MKPFNSDLARKEYPLIDRLGRKAAYFRYDPANSIIHPHIIIYYSGITSRIDNNGRFFDNTVETILDIFMANNIKYNNNKIIIKEIT